MHETSVAKNIVDLILAEKSRQKAKPVSAKITCGSFNCVNDELLKSAFQAAAEDTACEGMQLEIEHIPICSKCRKCNKIFEFDVTKSKCSKCGSEDFDFLPDEPLTLKSVEFDTEQTNEKKD
jgi:hydrogenase nickel incorporation protein HypA/HybF